MTRALLIIDVQLDYFPGGAFPLVEPEAAAAAAGAVLGAARAAGDVVVHLTHLERDPDAAFFRAGTPGLAVHPAVAPIEGETVLTKHEPNGFRGTGLQRVLEDAGATELVVVGMMTSMCVDSTARTASELGFDVTVVGDACAAPDLEQGGAAVPAAAVQAAFLAALDGTFARVLTSAELLQGRPAA